MTCVFNRIEFLYHTGTESTAEYGQNTPEDDQAPEDAQPKNVIIFGEIHHLRDGEDGETGDIEVEL
jgi:hypothetical protein